MNLRGPLFQTLTARLLLILLGALGAWWLSRLDYTRKISTNVIDLVPASERSPEIVLLRTLADEHHARVVLLALRHADADQASSAATNFAAQLRASPAFAEAIALGDTSALADLARFIHTRRFELLLPSWLAAQDRAFVATTQPESERAAWLAERVAKNLDRFLARPEATAFQELLPSDPLLLVPELLEHASPLAPAAAPRRPGEPATALVWARLAASPLSEAGQAPAFTAIDNALAAAQANHPGLELRWTGVNRFAAASKDRIRTELDSLNALSLVAVLTIAVLGLAQPWRALHLFPILVFSILGGWCAATLFFERLHILVFVVGALLTGVAVDYAFYLYLQPARLAGEPYLDKLARLLRPLLASCLTTAAGFLFLLLSDLPLIRQLGVFVSAGLVSALLAAILYFAQLREPYAASRPFASRPLLPRSRRIPALLIAAITAVALLGPWRLHWNDNIRQLDAPDPALITNDHEVRALFGETPNRSVYFTRGATLAEARAHLDAFIKWTRSTQPDATTASLGLLLPTADDYAASPARLTALSDFPAKLGAALAAHGYTVEAFAPFLDAWQTATSPAALSRRPVYEQLALELQSHLTGPLALLLFRHGESTWFLSFTDHSAPLPLESAATPPSELATTNARQLETLNSLFARYRASALRLSLLGLGLIGGSVLILYGPRRGLRVFAIPCLATLFAFGLLGALGQTLNLFHLLGAFLGVCLSHNYAIFSAESAPGPGHHASAVPPVSIRLSALTTTASFGVLAFSRIPVVSALGSTVALIVLTALLLVELATVSRRPVPRLAS